MLPLALAATLVLGALPASADAVDAAVNSSRANPLPNRAPLEQVAAASAANQAASGRIGHTWLGGLTSYCSAAGEIVGAGGSVSAVFSAFRNSAVHWEQIVRPSWTAMGTAAVTGADGRVYVSVVFCTEAGAAPPAPPPAPEPTPTPTPAPTSPPSAPRPAPVAGSVPVAASPDFADVFLRLINGELDDLWQQAVDGVSISLVIGPSIFLPEEEWVSLSQPAVD